MSITIVTYLFLLTNHITATSTMMTAAPTATNMAVAKWLRHMHMPPLSAFETLTSGK